MSRAPTRPPTLISRPLPVVKGKVQPLATRVPRGGSQGGTGGSMERAQGGEPSPPGRVLIRPRMRSLQQASGMARLLPAHPHLHAFTFADLAREWGVPEYKLKMRLTGIVEVSGQDLLFMADELGVTPHELMAGIVAYTPAHELARRRAKIHEQMRRHYAKNKAALEAAGRVFEKTGRAARPKAPPLDPAKFTRTGKRKPIQTVLMERLPPNERQPLPTPPPIPRKVKPHGKAQS